MADVEKRNVNVNVICEHGSETNSENSSEDDYGTKDQATVYVPPIFPAAHPSYTYTMCTNNIWDKYGANQILNKVKYTSKTTRDLSIGICIVAGLNFILFGLFFEIYILNINDIKDQIKSNYAYIERDIKDLSEYHIDDKYKSLKSDIDFLAKYHIDNKYDYLKQDINGVKDQIYEIKASINEIKRDDSLIKMHLDFVQTNDHDVRSYLSEMRAMLAALNQKIENQETILQLSPYPSPTSTPNMIKKIELTEQKQ